MTRTEKLTNEINKIYDHHRDGIHALPLVGPRGGRNAATIDGWTTTAGIGAISKAAKKSAMPTLKWWDGPCRTPAVAIPLCTWAEIYEAYRKIFNR